MPTSDLLAMLLGDARLPPSLVISHEAPSLALPSNLPDPKTRKRVGINPEKARLARLKAVLQHLSSEPLDTPCNITTTNESLPEDLAADLIEKDPPLKPFIYSRLSKEEKTRILILAPGLPDDDLYGELKHIRSLQDHEYESLSYVWGSKSGQHTINCSMMEIQITPNLDAALRKLRLPDKPRVLWVDAICINQANLVERSHQVGLMQEIYSNSKQVVVWLGKSSPTDSLAFDSLNRLRLSLDIQEDAWFFIRLGWYRDKSGRIFSGRASRSALTDMEYEHLINLLRRDWFRRTWIIQEVASAKNALVVCGDKSIKWETLADVYMRLGDRFLPITQFGGQDAQHSLENIAAIETARRSHTGPLSMSLFHILVATAFSQCTDQRDKIFGVLGLAKNWLEKGLFVPDYDTSEERILEDFKAFAVADSNQNQDLRTLSCASGTPCKSPGSQLPSWVPDWRRVENAHPFVRYSDRTKFSASGGMKAEAWHSHNKSVLHVTGKKVDSIESLGIEPTFSKTIAVFEINEQKIKAIKNSLEWLQDCHSLALDANGNLSEKRHEELWRTMTCGLTGDGFPAPKRYSDYFYQYLDFMDTAPDRFGDYLDESQGFPQGVLKLNDAVPRYETHAIIEASIEKWSSRRQICTTNNGRLACVPKGSARGDLICVLYGGEVPYVLRPVGYGFYTVVGECYVDDIMHGESLSHDTMAKEFKLR